MELAIPGLSRSVRIFLRLSVLRPLTEALSRRRGRKTRRCWRDPLLQAVPRGVDHLPASLDSVSWSWSLYTCNYPKLMIQSLFQSFLLFPWIRTTIRWRFFVRIFRGHSIPMVNMFNLWGVKTKKRMKNHCMKFRWSKPEDESCGLFATSGDDDIGPSFKVMLVMAAGHCTRSLLVPF